MNKKVILSIAGVTLCAIAAHAYTKEVYITGATAFRANAKNALLVDFNCVQKDNSNIDKANKRTWVSKNAVGGIAAGEVAVFESYTGSSAGLVTVANGASINFYGPGAATNFLHTADFAFSDVKQASSDAANLTALTGEAVAVQTFVIAKGSNSVSQSVTNIDHNLMKIMLANGGMYAGHINGNGTDTTFVYLVGRDNTSGTRIENHVECDFGIGNASQLARAVTNSTGVAADASTGAGDGFVIAWSPGFLPAPNATLDPGYNSGSKVCYVLKNHPLPCLGYTSVGDADANSLNFAMWEGCAFPAYGAATPIAVVVNGAYKYWSYEMLYQATTLETWVGTTFQPYFVGAIATTLDGRTGIKISDMKVARDVDGGPVYPIY